MSYSNGHESYNSIFTPEQVQFSNKDVKHQVVMIDSRDRDMSSYPNANQYEITFPYVYKDILSLEVIGAEMPKSQTIIHSGNNKLYASNQALDADQRLDVSNYSTLTMPVGNYTGAEIATSLTSIIDTAFSSTVTVSHSSSTSKLTFTDAPTNFFIYLNDIETDTNSRQKYVSKTDSVAHLLGLRSTDKYVTHSSGTVSFSGQLNLKGEPSIYMRIDDITRAESSNNKLRGIFAKFPVADKAYGEYKTLKVSDFGSKAVEVFSPYKGRMEKLKLSFYNPNGTLYDFDGIDHSLSLEIRTMYKNNNY